MTESAARLRSGETLGLPEMVHSALLGMASQLEGVALGIRARERRLMAWRRSNATSRRIGTIPGMGLITAAALAASVKDTSVFRSGGSSRPSWGWCRDRTRRGGKWGLGHIPMMGNGYPRRLLVVGATSVISRAGADPTRTGAWVRSTLERKPPLA